MTQQPAKNIFDNTVLMREVEQEIKQLLTQDWKSSQKWRDGFQAVPARKDSPLSYSEAINVFQQHADNGTINDMVLMKAYDSSRFAFENNEFDQASFERDVATFLEDGMLQAQRQNNIGTFVEILNHIEHDQYRTIARVALHQDPLFTKGLDVTTEILEQFQSNFLKVVDLEAERPEFLENAVKFIESCPVSAELDVMRNQVKEVCAAKLANPIKVSTLDLKQN